DDASRRMASAFPYRASNAPNAIGPIPCTPATIAHASRSSSVGSHGRRADGGPSGSDMTVGIPSAGPSLPIGPASPTPSMSGRLGSGQPQVDRAVPGRLLEMRGVDGVGTRQIRDRPGDAEDPFRASPGRMLHLGQADECAAAG